MDGYSLNNVLYGDTSGDGEDEAFVVIEWSGGTSSRRDAYVFEMNKKCQPEFLGKADLGGFEEPRLSRKALVVKQTFLKEGEPRCCPTGERREEWKVVKGKLKRTKNEVSR